MTLKIGERTPIDIEIICTTKIDPPTFDGILDPKTFSNWMADLDYYFDWYRFTEKNRI